MNPRFTIDGTVYTVRESPDWSILVNRIIGLHMGADAARNWQDIRESEFPRRSWTGTINGMTYSIAELEPAPIIAQLVAATDAVKVASDALGAAQTARDDLARAALADDQPAALVASAAGLSLPRVYQIRDRRR